MKVEDVKKVLRSISEDKLDFDDPHVTSRCTENNISREDLIRILLYETDKLTNIIEDRPKVYKLYFKLSKRRQLKIIIDLIKYGRIMVRTIKILDRKLYKKIKVVRRRK